MCKKFKKIWFSLLIVIITVSTFNIVYANEEDLEEVNVDEIWKEVIQTGAGLSKEPNLNSRSVVVFDRKTKTVLFNKNMDEKRAMASTTKIMTAIIVLEKGNLSDVVEVSKKAANTGGSRLKLNTGDKITLNDLLYGLMLRSRK